MLCFFSYIFYSNFLTFFYILKVSFSGYFHRFFIQLCTHSSIKLTIFFRPIYCEAIRLKNVNTKEELIVRNLFRLINLTITEGFRINESFIRKSFPTSRRRLLFKPLNFVFPFAITQSRNRSIICFTHYGRQCCF